MNRWIALLAALAGALLLGWLGTRTPDVDLAAPPADAYAFNTAAAMDDIRQIARAPHPVGSAENARVREWLVGRMTALGLSPEVQAGDAVETRDWGGETRIVGGAVKNVVGVLPGKDRGKPALALMAHYDSAPNSPGAADDAAGVAAALDIIRALKLRGTPERDVIVIMTDGEEAGLLGARLFFAEHPLRKRVGLLINMEARGSGGRANMFQTGPDNGELVRAFAGTANRPISNSLAVFLYENMPNDTDFTVSKEAGVPGLNFAFIGRQFDYHSPTATVENLDVGSVKHMGDQALAAAATFAFAAELPGRAPDVVYSQTFGDHILHYPAWAGWIVLLVTGGLIAFGAPRARRAAGLPLPDVAKGAAAALFLALATATLLNLLRRATGIGFGFYEQRPLLGQWAVWETALALATVGMLLVVPRLATTGGGRLRIAGLALLGGLAASIWGGWDMVGAGLGVGAAIFALLAFGRAISAPAAWLGVLLVGLVAAVALQVAVPTVALIVAWPLALAAVGAAATGLGVREGLAPAAVLAVLAAVGGGWLAVYFHGVAQGLDMPAVLALFALLGGLLFWPLAARTERRRLLVGPESALVLAIVLTAVIGDGGSARHPRATQVMHVTEGNKGWVISTMPGKLDDWSQAVLGDEDAVVERAFPPLRRKVRAAPSRPAPAGAPPVVVSRHPDGRFTILARPASTVMLELAPKGPFASELVVAGRTVALPREAAGKPVHLRWSGGGEPLAVAFRPTAPSGELGVRYAGVSPDWPAHLPPLPPRLSKTMPFDQSDSSVLISSRSLVWSPPVASGAVPTQEPPP